MEKQANLIFQVFVVYLKMAIFPLFLEFLGIHILGNNLYPGVFSCTKKARNPFLKLSPPVPFLLTLALKV